MGRKRPAGTLANAEIAALLEKVGAFLALKGENPFKVRAYENAALTVRNYEVPLARLVADGADLTRLPGIGRDMAAHIQELVTTGRLEKLEALRREVPAGLLQVMGLNGVGPKRARALWRELGITTVEELEEACRAGRVAALRGFGRKSQEKILQAIAEVKRRVGRLRLAEVDQIVRPLLRHLAEAPGVVTLEVAGSYRRRRDTVGDVDLLAVSETSGPLMERFVGYPLVRQVLARGETRASVILAAGLQVDLRVVPAASYGAALCYFTGSKAHNIALRRRAQERGLKVSEYGVFRPGDGGEDRVAGRTEEEVYRSLGLPWIPPELREDRGEIEAAAAGRLPQLLTLEDLRGDLQMHTTWSDGKDTLETMVRAAVARGYEYVAVTDHTRALAMTGGLDEERLRRQGEAIAAVQDACPQIRILRGAEVDIHRDGTLDLADEVLCELDWVLAAVHSHFQLPMKEQTERVLRALRHPAVHALAHPTGRLLLRREPIQLDLDAVIACAAEEGVALELNAHPERLDLHDVHLLAAKRQGVKIVLGTDAHRADELGLMRYGVDQARRGWLEPGDVLNTLPLADFLGARRSPPQDQNLSRRNASRRKK